MHEFVHDNFRADRIDLLSKVCRKTGAKGKYLHDEVVKSTEDSPQKETNSVSRLKLCQVHLLNVNCDIKKKTINLFSYIKKKFMIVSETSKIATNLNVID